MAGSKKTTSLNVPKVKRGVKNALTPGETPEKEQTPIEKVIGRELTKIVENINFDAKFESIKTAIESKETEHLLPVLEKINNKLNPILGALYGIPSINNNINPESLLNKLGNLDPRLTMFGPIDSMLNSIYELLLNQINDKSSYKLFNNSATNYDSIIENINDNTNAVIDIITEKFSDAIDAIKKLVNTNDFNLRTAQIMDAISLTPNDAKSATKVLQYDININANGLDTGIVEALIDLSKINLDSNEYLKNLDSILESLSNFEVLNNVVLDNKSIENIVNSIDILDNIKIDTNIFDPFAIDCLKYFIETLGSIDLSALDRFDEETLKSISIITSTLGAFSNLKLENFNKNIQSLNVEDFVKLLNTLKDIPVYDKEDKTTMTAISDLFEAISSISGFDENKFNALSSNLRKMIRLTEKPTTFTKLKISDRGLIHILMHNIGAIAAETEQTFDNTKNIGKMLNLICSISQYDPKLFDNLKRISYILSVVTSKDEPYLYKAFKNIEEIGKVLSEWDAKKGPVVLIGNQLRLINDMSSMIKLKDISSLAIKSTIAWGAMHSLVKTFNYLKEISELNKNTEEHIKTINNALVGINSIKSIDISKIENLNESIKTIIVSFTYLKTLNAIADKKTDVSSNIKVLNNIVNQINNIKEIKDTKSLSYLKDSLKLILEINLLISIIGITAPLANFGASAIEKEMPIIAKVVEQINAMPVIDKKFENNINSLSVINKFIGINITLAIIGITAPLAYLGAFVIEKEVDILIKVVGKINKIKPINKKAISNLKSISIILITASSLLLFGAFVGGFVLSHLGEIIGFTVVLSTFIFLTIGALNLATRGMKEAITNVKAFGMILAISGGLMLLGGLIMTLYAPLILGSLGFAIALGAFIFLTIDALNLASKNINSSIKTAEDLIILVGMAASIMLIGGILFTLHPELMLTTLLFGVYLTAFVVGITYLFNWAGVMVDDATSNAEKFAVLVGVASISLLLGGFLFMTYPWMMYTTLLFGVYLTAFVTGVTLLFNMVGGSLDEVVSAADKFAILVGISALSLCLGGFLFQEYPWMMLTTLLFGVYLAAFVGAVVFAFSLASKYIERAEIDALNFAKVIGISAAAMLIGGLFMLIPGMALAVLKFSAIFVLFMGVTLLAYTLASKHIKSSKEAAIGFGVIVLLTSAALLLGGGLMLAFPGLDVECLKFVWLSALFVSIFGVAIWALGKIDKKNLIQGEIALAGIAVLIAGFGYAFTFVAEAMDIISQVNDPWTQLGIMGTVFAAMIALVAGITALTTGTAGIGVAAIAAAEGLIAGLEGLIWGLGKAMSAIAQSMADLDKVKDFKASSIIEALTEYVSIVPAIAPLADPRIVINMMAAQKSVSSMSEAIMDISTSVKAACDLKTSDGKNLTVSDFTLAAQNVKSVVTILGRALLEVYKENKEIFSAGTLGDLFGADTPFSRVSKSCSTMGQLITNISAGVKDFAELKMPIYDENGQIKGYRPMTSNDFKNAADSVYEVVTCLSTALLQVYKGNEDMFNWRLIGDNPFAMVSESCSTMGQLITDISAGVKDFAELKMPIYDENGQIKGYREMTDADFTKAGEAISKVVTCISGALISIYNDPNNKDMFTDPSLWHTSADKTPFGMITKALSGVGTLVKDSAAAIKEIADMNIDFKPLEGKDGKVAKIVSILAKSIMDVYNEDPTLFTDDSFWHTDPEKTKFGMVMQCLNTLGPFVKEAAATVNDINKMEFKASDLADNGEVYLKVNRLVGVIPKSIIDLIKSKYYGKYLTDDDYEDTYSSMATMYGHFKTIIENAADAYTEVLKLDFKENSLDTVNTIIGNILTKLPEKVIGELKTHEDFYSNISILDNVVNAFKKYSEIINKVAKAYEIAIKSLNKIGISGNDTTIINTITNNLNTLVSKLSDAIKLDTISLDAASVNTFTENVSKYSSAIKQLADVYSLVPEDLTRYDNVIKAIEGVNFKIAEIQNLDAFEREQKILEKYVITLNNLDLTKVEALSNLMSIMNELATKLGTLDNFTEVLNNKLSKTLSNLASQIKASGDIINKADSLQKKRHEAIKASIKEIQSIMDQKLIVEVNHNEIKPNGGDYDKGGGDNSRTPEENNKPSFFERAGNAISNMFNGNSSDKNTPSNTTQPAYSNTGGITSGIDYDRLRTVIMEAITQASGSGVDINRK